ncbi:MAG: endolytic transglycosylase MltG [marine benthic group bacterium]|nr:endolytic transglycosylase MltG [Gemmatimonadota bacterium]
MGENRITFGAGAKSRSRALRAGLLAGLVLLGACDDRSTSPDRQVQETEVVVPAGATTLEVGEALRSAGLVRYPRAFALTARVMGLEESLKAGRYRFARDASWFAMLDQLERGSVQTVPLTIPEGFTLRQIGARIAAFTGDSPDSVRLLLGDPAFVSGLKVPGPTLEGYLFPDTYRFADDLPARAVILALVERYREFWTLERRARLDSLGLTERELVTLASIVEKEARVGEERPVIAGVYWNRLQRGMLLQADPTVQYALGGEPRERLLYADIDSVAGHPYNTYTQPGLPPGPIASPGEAALDASLSPAEVPYLYFVARPDGSHEFTRTNREHINAKNRIRAESGR